MHGSGMGMNHYVEDESIYNLIPPRYQPMPKPPMYRSSISGTIPPTGSVFAHKTSTCPMMANLAGDIPSDKALPAAHRNFGKAPGNYHPDPNNFLKMNKSNSVPNLARVKKEQPHLLQPSHLKPRKLPAVPRATELPILNLVTSKNFIVANAVETILAAPKKTSQGAKDYLHKEDYGKVPKYLTHIKKDIDAEYDYIRALQQQEEDAQASGSRLLGDDEKAGLITGLKAKWEQVNTLYQGGTHMTKLDTMGKIRRKEKYEAELSSIEKDIEKLNRKNIYVDAYS